MNKFKNVLTLLVIGTLVSFSSLSSAAAPLAPVMKYGPKCTEAQKRECRSSCIPEKRYTCNCPMSDKIVCLP